MRVLCRAWRQLSYVRRLSRWDGAVVPFRCIVLVYRCVVSRRGQERVRAGRSHAYGNQTYWQNIGWLTGDVQSLSCAHQHGRTSVHPHPLSLAQPISPTRSIVSRGPRVRETNNTFTPNSPVGKEEHPGNLRIVIGDILITLCIHLPRRVAIWGTSPSDTLARSSEQEGMGSPAFSVKSYPAMLSLSLHCQRMVVT